MVSCLVSGVSTTLKVIFLRGRAFRPIFCPTAALSRQLKIFQNYSEGATEHKSGVSNINAETKSRTG